jgi:hypothetical protein
MPEAMTVPGFLPSTDGLHFPNSFPPGPTLRLGFLDTRRLGFGDAAQGLCGGMCVFVRRRFESGQPVPADNVSPANGSVLFRSLVREQLRSLRAGIVPFRFWRLSSMAPLARLRRTRNREWPAIKASLDSGRLAVIGLVRVEGRHPLKLVGNHQVVAYGYEADGASVRVRIYDPNWPNRDDIWVPVDGSGPQSTGEHLLGVVALD